MEDVTNESFESAAEKPTRINCFSMIAESLDRIAVSLEKIIEKGIVAPVATPAMSVASTKEQPSKNKRTILLTIEGEGKEWTSGKGATYKAVAATRIPTGDGNATKFFSLFVVNSQRKFCSVGAEVEVAFTKLEGREFNGKKYYSIFADDVIPQNRDQVAESNIEVSGNDEVPF